jgi:phage baseplate assembly protein W
VSGCAAVDAALAVLIGTVAGERPMRPDFGIRLGWRKEELPERIRELVEAHEPRIDVRQIVLVAARSWWQGMACGGLACGLRAG